MVSEKTANLCSKDDLISNLPDDLLCLILSFLPTKEAASTSLLAKRWSNLLVSVPILDLDDSVLLHPQKSQRQVVVFNEFFDRLLALHDKNSLPDKKVSLTLGRKVLKPELLWIVRVLNLGVVDFTIRLDADDIILPLCVFTWSKTLVNLRIGTRVRLHETNSICRSPMLKSLVLDSVKFHDAKVGFKPILRDFPSIQNLSVYEANKWNYWNGSISSPTLKSFIYRSDDDPPVIKPCVSFDTPGLEYLEYSDTVADKYENVNLDSLIEARLDLHLTPSQIMPKFGLDNIGFVPGGVKILFKAIRNVKILSLSHDALEALYYRGETVPVFNNLVCLSLGSGKPHGSPLIFWKLLPSLLVNSPNLETLIIKGLVHYVKEGWEGFYPEYVRCTWDLVCDYLSSSAVKFLKISGYEG